jgi:hypothetical protein
MKYRQSTIMAETTYTANKTEIIDLNLADPISQLKIRLAATNNGDIATAHAIACLTKIELVDGSDVLFSLSGYEAEAVDIYHNKRMRPNWNPYLNDMDVVRVIGINFGRHLWDPDLAFDPSKFTNPQLKLTLDIDAGGNAADSNKLAVFANLFDEKAVSPIGFLMHKEVKDYAMAVSSHEYTDLPIDYPYRKIFIRQQTPGTEPDQHISNIKLSEDQDKKIILNHSTGDLFHAICDHNPMLTELIMFPIAAASRHGYCTMATRVNGVITPWALANAPGDCSFYDGDGGEFHHIGAAGGNVQAIVSGWHPHATFELPMGDQDDIEDWFDASALRALKLDITSSAGALTTDSVQVFLQQLRRY